MERKKKILFIVAVLFTLLMAFLAYDMFTRTGKPWDRKKNNIIDKYKVKYRN